MGVINQAAGRRHVTTDQLEDRVAPDCGLDERGGRFFNYGPRQFKLVFDEHFRPRLAHPDGDMLSKLPDAEDGDVPAEVERCKAAWALMSRRLEEILDIQTERLRRSMVQARHWSTTDWSKWILDHPLMVNYAQRLHNERHNNTLGACLYNLGRIVQPDDPAAAAAYYRDSVRVRPNDAVSAQLAQLAQAESEPAECRPSRCVGPLPSEDEEEDGPYETAIRAAVVELSGADTGTSADGWYGDDSVDIVGKHGNFAYIVVASSDARFVCPLDIHGDFGENSIGSVARAQWIEGGESEVTVDFNTSASGHEEGISNTMGATTRHFYGLENGAMWSFGRLKVSEYYEDGMWDDCHCDDGDSEDASPWDCCGAIRDLGGRVDWSISSAGAGLLRVTRHIDDRQTENDSEEGPATEVVAVRELCARSTTQ